MRRGERMLFGRGEDVGVDTTGGIAGGPKSKEGNAARRRCRASEGTDAGRGSGVKCGAEKGEVGCRTLHGGF